MRESILNEQQLKFRLVEIYKEEQIKLIEERWNNLLPYEKKFVFEFVKEFSPKESKKLNEARWWNTLGDIVGIFDPTGIVDVINALDYFRQGDNLFGFMSLVSAVPYVGDLVGKPIIGLLKSGGEISRIFKGLKTPSQWAIAAKKYPILEKLFNSISEIGPKLIDILKNVPGGKKFLNVVREWVNMITKALKEYKSISQSGKVTSKTGKVVSSEFRMFRDYGLTSDMGTLKRLWKKGGLFKNRQLSRLLVKTKFWLGFLDLVGVSDFVGPEELEQQMGQEEFNAKMSEYMESPEGKKMWESEMSQLEREDTSEKQPEEQEPTQDKKSNGDVIGDLINLVGGAKTLGGLI